MASYAARWTKRDRLKEQQDKKRRGQDGAGADDPLASDGNGGRQGDASTGTGGAPAQHHPQNSSRGPASAAVASAAARAATHGHGHRHREHGAHHHHHHHHHHGLGARPTPGEVAAAARVAAPTRVDGVKVKVSPDLDDADGGGGNGHRKHHAAAATTCVDSEVAGAGPKAEGRAEGDSVDVFVCRRGCGAEFHHAKLRAKHEVKKCQHRTVVCENLGCGMQVKLLNLPFHRKFCLHRAEATHPARQHARVKGTAARPRAGRPAAMAGPAALSPSRGVPLSRSGGGAAKPLRRVPSQPRLLASAEASSERGGGTGVGGLEARLRDALEPQLPKLHGDKLASETGQAARRRRMRDHTVRFKADEILHYDEDHAVFNEPWYDFPDRKEALLRLFQLVDTDGTGFLDAHKFRRMGRAQGGVDCSLVQAEMEIAKADADGDGMLSAAEWLKFSEPLRAMPARGFLTLMQAFTQSLQETDAAAVMGKVRRQRMFDAQDAYDDRQAEAAVARKRAAAQKKRQDEKAATAAAASSVPARGKGLSRESALVAEVREMLARSTARGRGLGLDEVQACLQDRHPDWALTRMDVHRAFHGAKDTERINEQVNMAAKESVLEAYAGLDPSWGIVVDPRDLNR